MFGEKEEKVSNMFIFLQYIPFGFIQSSKFFAKHFFMLLKTILNLNQIFIIQYIYIFWNLLILYCYCILSYIRYDRIFASVCVVYSILFNYS